MNDPVTGSFNPTSEIRNPKSVVLVTDKGERKATGSYYTPDYIVQYIVENTVGPLLEAARAHHAGDEAALVRAVLAVNVLDPSMGSGHFLVAATDFIARFLVEQELSEAAGAGQEMSYWRRRVVQSCIYGVDLNPLAVELAKLSLWLATVARDKPLSFLDHHLRVGNSLVGARVAELEVGATPLRSRKQQRAKRERAEAEAAGQLSMLEDSAFVGHMRTATRFMDEIEGTEIESLDDVHRVEALYIDTVREVTRRYRTLADVLTARHFGLEADETLLHGLREYLLRGGFEMPRYAELIAQAGAIARERRFFHWELEFPEVFFDEHGRLLAEASGFEAVVGNPPYVRQEQLSLLKPWFAQHFAEVYAGTADLFVYFFAQGLALTMENGRLSYISSNSWIRANYATALRAFLRSTATIESLVDLGDNRIFQDAPDVYAAIPVVRQAAPPPDHSARAASFNRGEGISDFARQLVEKLQTVAIHNQPDEGWQLDDSERSLFSKLMARGVPLAEVVENRIYRGVLTGLNEAFIVDEATRNRLVAEDARSAELIKPLLRGADLRPWYQAFQGEYLIVVPAGWTSARVWCYLAKLRHGHASSVVFPLLPRTCSPSRKRARNRQDKGEFWWELRPCDYYDAFERTKDILA